MRVSSWSLAILLLFFLLLFLLSSVNGGNFYQDCNIIWGDGRGQILNGGQFLTLSLDNISGSAFQSNDQYLFGRFDMQIKFVLGDSAGTVIAYYLTSDEPDHNEIDFEFLGNISGEPYTIHTNIFTQGNGGREMQFRLWFDPTLDFHTYSIIWNPQHVIFEVDGVPLRDFKNLMSQGIDFPIDQPMRLLGSLWDAEQWATWGGRKKTNWTNAPFIASFRNFNASSCVWPSSNSNYSCSFPSTNSSQFWWNKQLNPRDLRRLKYIHKAYLIYNYCADRTRFPDVLPPECLH